MSCESQNLQKLSDTALKKHLALHKHNFKEARKIRELNVFDTIALNVEARRIGEISTELVSIARQMKKVSRKTGRGIVGEKKIV